MEELILKEWEIIQSIIARQEEMRMKSRNWYITIVTAITVALFSKDVSLSKEYYLIISLFLSVLFLWIELIHRVAEQRAIERSSAIEAALRKKAQYKGPQIGQSLSKPNSLKEQIKALDNIRIYSTYVMVAVLTIIIYFSRI